MEGIGCRKQCPDSIDPRVLFGDFREQVDDGAEGDVE